VPKRGAIAFPVGSFDIVMQFMAFSSILDQDTRMLVAAEMVRVAGTSGAILWYDFFVDNPANRDAWGVREGEIKQLFPRCHVSAERMTLAPPLARCLAGLSWSLCHGLAAVRMLGTHCLALIRPCVEKSAWEPRADSRAWPAAVRSRPSLQ